MRSRGTFLIVACAGLLFGSPRLAAAQSMPASDQASSTSSTQDMKLEKKIDQRLQHDKKLKARNVDASVSNGVVTLTGTVRTSAEKKQAEHLARTKGISDVDNQIEIEGQQPAQQGTQAAPPQGSTEPGTPAPSEGQQAQPQEGNVRERTTHTEERTETRTEKVPQPSNEQQQQPSTAPSDETMPRPAAPSPPSTPGQRSTVPQE